MYIEKIEVFEFSVELTEQQINMIDDIFRGRIKSKPSLYVVKEFVWSKLHGEFVDVDTLAMDICAEEWRHYDLFHDFSLNETLLIDIANKDYRDPYYNSYLDGYLKILLSKWYPDIITGNSFEYLLPARNDKLVHYFINQYRHQIIRLITMDEKDRRHYEVYDIPIVTSLSKEIVLYQNEPDPEVLKTMLPKYGSITFILSNYGHLTEPLLYYLINNPNHEQIYAINFENDFVFQVPDETLPIPSIAFPMEKRKFLIRIEQCNSKNAAKLEEFLKYLMKLFTNIALQEDVELWLTFSDCRELDDCPTLGSIGKIFKTIALEDTNFSETQLTELSRSITNRSKLRFHHSSNLEDANVIQFVSNSNMEIMNLNIEGTNSCTLILYFALAEHIMNAEGVNCVKGRRFWNLVNLLPKDKFKSNLTSLEFFRTDDGIVLRNSSKTVIDIYCLINDVPQDDGPPFDYD